MSPAETQLLQLLKERSFSAAPSAWRPATPADYYIDGKMTEVFSAGAHLIGEVLYEQTKDLDARRHRRPGSRGRPLTTAAVISYHLHGREMEGFWVRDKVKGARHAESHRGQPEAGRPRGDRGRRDYQGSSAVKAVKEVQNLDCEVVLVLALVDRLQGAGELLKENGIENYRSVFTLRDFGVEK